MRVAGYADQGDTQRGYVKFDLSSIPAGTVIRKATLCLYSYDTTKMQGSTGYYAAHRITRTWNDMTMTYNIADTGTNWTTPGGDFEATADALSPKKAPKVPSWYEWDLTTRAQQWINDPAGNFGWLIKAQRRDQPPAGPVLPVRYRQQRFPAEAGRQRPGRPGAWRHQQRRQRRRGRPAVLGGQLRRGVCGRPQLRPTVRLQQRRQRRRGRPADLRRTTGRSSGRRGRHTEKKHQQRLALVNRHRRPVRKDRPPQTASEGRGSEPVLGG